MNEIIHYPSEENSILYSSSKPQKLSGTQKRISEKRREGKKKNLQEWPKHEKISDFPP